MKKEDVYIPDQSYSSDEIHHGGKWSEEAKQRYREARRAGRSVYDMFGNFYNKANKQVTSKANNIANRTIYKQPIAKAEKATKDTLRKADKAVTSTVNKHVSNKDRKHIDKEEKKYIDKRRKSALNVAVKRKKYINKQYEESVNKANREANIESVKNTFNFINGKEKKEKIYEKRKKALKKAKSQANNYWSEATKDVRKSIKDAEERTVDKYTYSSVKDIADKNVRSLKKKAGKTLNDINTNKGKGYKLTGKSKVTPKGGYERYASDDKGNAYGRRQVSVTTEGTRANSITDALTGKTNDYKEYSTKTEYKMWKDKKKKKVKHSGLDKVYFPGRTGVSETILHSDFFK